MFVWVESDLCARMSKHKGLSGYTAQILSLNIEYKSVSHLFIEYRVLQVELPLQNMEVSEEILLRYEHVHINSHTFYVLPDEYYTL